MGRPKLQLSTLQVLMRETRRLAKKILHNYKDIKKKPYEADRRGGDAIVKISTYLWLAHKWEDNLNCRNSSKGQPQ